MCCHGHKTNEENMRWSRRNTVYCVQGNILHCIKHKSKHVEDFAVQSQNAFLIFFCFVFCLPQRKPNRAKLEIKRDRTEILSDPKKLAVCLGGYDIPLEEEQCYLNRCGVVHLIIKLIKTSPSHNVFLEVIELAVAMLSGGNPDVQVSCLGGRK